MASVTDNKMIIYQSEVQEYSTRLETLNGREYVVVPVTMMVEGVHQGSHGALLHTAEELGKIPESWNGIPVTVGHPVVEGNNVSANSPSVLESWQIGVVFNTIINGDKLKSEAWLEKTKLSNHENLNDRITNGEIIEVSVGVFSEDEEVEGSWHNETYDAVARNLRPDHLAILPNQVGACSIEDGCGIRVNSKNKKGESIMDVKMALGVLQKNGYKTIKLANNSEKGLLEMFDVLRELVRSLNPDIPIDNSYPYHYLIEVYDTYLIYERDTNQTTDYYKRGYQFNIKTGEAEFTSEPIEVEKNVEYKTVMNSYTEVKRKRGLQTNLKKEDETMANEKCTPCVAKKVDGLIANASTNFAETDREWLETLEEDQLDRMVPVSVEPTVNKESVKITPEMAVNALREGLKNENDFIKLMPTNMQEQTRSALRLFEERKTSLIESIMSNTEKDTWTREELQVYEVEKLEKIAKTAGVKQAEVQVNYSGMGAGTSLHNNTSLNDVPLMAPAGIVFEN